MLLSVKLSELTQPNSTYSELITHNIIIMSCSDNESESVLLKPQQSIDLIENYVDISQIDDNLSKKKLFKSLTKKRIIFIRHSQSTWNHASEKSNVDRMTNVAKGLFESMYNKKDLKDGGKYIDAPLSDLGILQCMDLNRFIQNHYMQNMLLNILKQTKSFEPAKAKDERKKNDDNHTLSEEFELLPPKSRLRKSFTKLNNLQSMYDRKSGNHFVYNNVNINNENDIDLIDDDFRDKLTNKDITSLMGINHDSCVLTSNLRRSIDTAIIGLSIRWQTFPLENLYILSCLQEFGKGPDCVSKTSAKDIPKIAQYTQNNKRINLKSLQIFYQTRIDSSMNFGPKKDDNVSRFDRMLEFCRYVFQRQESTIIACGHSIWFQRFAKIFLLQNQTQTNLKSQNNTNNANNNDLNNYNSNHKKKKNHIAITSKIYNTGIVGFDLCRIIKGSTDYYGIDSRTMTAIYKGFEKMDKLPSSSNKKQQ